MYSVLGGPFGAKAVFRFGYLLSEEGFAIGSDNEIEVPPHVIFRCGLLGGYEMDEQQILDALADGTVNIKQLVDAMIVRYAMAEYKQVERHRYPAHNISPVYGLMQFLEVQSEGFSPKSFQGI